MKKEIRKMMHTGIQMKKLNIRHMGQPGKGMIINSRVS
jgi:hypothetical protein